MTTKTVSRLFSVSLAASAALAPAASAATLDGLQQASAAADPAAALSALFDRSNARGSVRALALPSGSGVTQADLRQAMLSDLDFIRSAFAAQYGPGLYKEAHEGWDLDKAIAAAKAQVNADPGMTIAQYHEVLRGFFNSMKDFHVSVQFDATEASSLPFTVVNAGGRYYIGYIDRSKLSEESFPFKVGDELVTFGGRPVADAVAELKAREGGNTAVTEEAIAALMLTSRRASGAGDVARGPVSVGVRPQGSDKVFARQLIWDYTPEMIGQPGSARFHTDSVAAGPLRRIPLMSDLSSPLAVSLGGTAANPFGIGGKESWVPALGEKTWEAPADSTYGAYIYKNPQGRPIGYLRIPSYEPADGPAAAEEFAELMKRFSDSTDGLVIDQVNNPGGSLFYMYALASLLSDQPLAAPRHRVAITQDDVSTAVDFLKLEPLVKNDAMAKKAFGAQTQDGYPVTYEFFRHMTEYSHVIVDSWNQGKNLTDPTFLDGVDQINPSPAPYTKPLVVLINELDFSCGDFFPAIMQDNKRATLFGTRTSGAGGFVRSVKFPNQVGVAGFSMTGSIAVRADKKPIENLGVTADVQYAPTSADLQTGFAPYAKAVNATMTKLIGGTASK